MKKIITALLLVSLLFSLVFSFSCSQGGTAPEEKKTIVFLGDSIAEGLAGPMPFNERESYAYYGIIGKTNGYAYYNRAVSGSTTDDLLAYVQREDDGVEMMKSLLTAADIIHISIVGNDLILSSRNTMMVSIASGDLEELHERRDHARQNLDATLAYIRSLNPTATIFLQTLYNPVNEDSPLIDADFKAPLASYGYTPDRYHELMDIAVREVNGIFSGYIADHAAAEGSETEEGYGPTYIADVYSEMERIREEDYTRWNRLFQEDGVHPKHEGHAVIASVLQKWLDELGFSGKNVLSNYKAIREAQLERVYPGLEGKGAVLKAIRAAKTTDEINRAYFGGILGKTPVNENAITLEGRHFEETKVFKFDTVSMLGINLLSYFNGARSYARFYEDGNFEMTAELSTNAAKLVRALLDGDPIDISEKFDLTILAPYVMQFFPGVDPYDLYAMVEAFETAHGIVLEGIDIQSEAFRQMTDTFRTTKHLVLSSSSLLKDRVRVRYVGQYRLVSYPAPLTGETVTAVYLNNAFNQGETYARMLLTKEEEGNSKMHMALEVLKLVIDVTER